MKEMGVYHLYRVGKIAGERTDVCETFKKVLCVLWELTGCCGSLGFVALSVLRLVCLQMRWSTASALDEINVLADDCGLGSV